VVQCGAVCCSMLQCVECVAVCCSVLHCCKVLLCVAVYCPGKTSDLVVFSICKRRISFMYYMYLNQHTAAQCNTLQQTFAAHSCIFGVIFILIRPHLGIMDPFSLCLKFFVWLCMCMCVCARARAFMSVHACLSVCVCVGACV